MKRTRYCSVELGDNAQLAYDVLSMKPAKGIPAWIFHTMDISLTEELSGHAQGDYRKDPVKVYLDMEKRVGVCFIDQFLPDNALSMSDTGFESNTKRTATTGAHTIILDGITIDSPEAVAEHMERFEFPRLQSAIASFDSQSRDTVDRLIRGERQLQELFGSDILKVPYGGFQRFPCFRYYQYGYENYFMAYALFPDLMEKDFDLQAELAVKYNEKVVQACEEGGLMKVIRLDHDMTDSRGPLVDIRSLERIWFPQFARAIRPLVDAGFRLLWHCDGNVTPMIPGLLESGIAGFQGFQYEDGVDYVKICKMKTRDGEPLMIWAGVSVTRTLPFGTKEDVVREMKWLVENGPPLGLVLGGSSSIVPGTNHENLKTMVEGLRYYREHGRG